MQVNKINNSNFKIYHYLIGKMRAFFFLTPLNYLFPNETLLKLSNEIKIK